MNLNAMNQFFGHYATCRPSWNPEWTVFKIVAKDGTYTNEFYELAPPVGGQITVDWGDGTVDNSKSHTYSHAGEYLVIVKNARRLGTYGKLYPTELLQCGNQATYISWLNSITLWLIDDSVRLPDTLTDMGSLFQNTSIESLPEGTTWPPLASYCGRAFRDCKMLKKLPESFYPGKNALYLGNFCSDDILLESVSSKFRFHSNMRDLDGTFARCVRLSNDISQFFVEPFVKVSMVGTFNKDANLKGLAPGKYLWEDTDKISNHSQCFTACTNLTNYDQIPADWK